MLLLDFLCVYKIDIYIHIFLSLSSQIAKRREERKRKKRIKIKPCRHINSDEGWRITQMAEVPWCTVNSATIWFLYTQKLFLSSTFVIWH